MNTGGNVGDIFKLMGIGKFILDENNFIEVTVGLSAKTFTFDDIPIYFNTWIYAAFNLGKSEIKMMLNDGSLYSQTINVTQVSYSPGANIVYT